MNIKDLNLSKMSNYQLIEIKKLLDEHVEFVKTELNTCKNKEEESL